MSRGWPIARLVTVVLVLLGSVWLGLKEGYDGYRGAETGLQRTAAVMQLLYGGGAIAALVGLWQRRPWLTAALIGWGVPLTLTAALAPVAWGGAPWISGLVSGVGMAVASALVAWGALAHVRSQP
jgi:hypothetical protein